MMFLYNLWLDMRQKAERKPAPLLIHHDLNVVERILRDQLTSSFKSIWVDNEEVYESVLRFVQRFQPALVSRVKLYTRSHADLRRVRHHGGAGESAAAEGVAEDRAATS